MSAPTINVNDRTLAHQLPHLLNSWATFANFCKTPDNVDDALKATSLPEVAYVDAAETMVALSSRIRKIISDDQYFTPVSEVQEMGVQVLREQLGVLRAQIELVALQKAFAEAQLYRQQLENDHLQARLQQHGQTQSPG